ncbi:ABC transporter ATP-binding protein [Leucobacter viscericola]|uniref:ABC transporter ATP-binding protein n=1 Tax=Leucobacter viscericola TaxID=2714935 RepID=A0A6G7XBP0_9MICO|nr:ABC transporter ATP-binding protein [Leucobacter viscericola]QIK61975.1 ABC transporter ATP-binding protein [Leucobacter viscericola]
MIVLEGVTRSYGSPPTQALGGVSFRVERGEFVGIVGPSGSGKSTLLNILGTLDRPTSGKVSIASQDVGSLSDDDLSGLRANRIGFVFQQFHLNEGRTSHENVADGLLYRGLRRGERIAAAARALEQVGLGHRLNHKPQQLSGGERQRVAIARATVGKPEILLADEPTGNLDSVSGAAVMRILHELNRVGTTIVMITHDRELAASLPRSVQVRDGLLVEAEAKK